MNALHGDPTQYRTTVTDGSRTLTKRQTDQVLRFLGDTYDFGDVDRDREGVSLKVGAIVICTRNQCLDGRDVCAGDRGLVTALAEDGVTVRMLHDPVETEYVSGSCGVACGRGRKLELTTPPPRRAQSSCAIHRRHPPTRDSWQGSVWQGVRRKCPPNAVDAAARGFRVRDRVHALTVAHALAGMTRAS